MIEPYEDDPKGECDNCRRVGVLIHCTAFGIETAVCRRCAGLPNETIHADGTIEVEGG